MASAAVREKRDREEKEKQARITCIAHLYMWLRKAITVNTVLCLKAGNNVTCMMTCLQGYQKPHLAEGIS